MARSTNPRARSSMACMFAAGVPARCAPLPVTCRPAPAVAQNIRGGQLMREVAPGLWHWTARHEHIASDVSSYYLLGERVVIDPMLPAEGLAWFQARGAPEHVLMTNRHHDRHAWRLREAFGCTG